MLFPNSSGPANHTMSRGQSSEDEVHDLPNRFEHLDLDLPGDKIPPSIPLQSQQAPTGITENPDERSFQAVTPGILGDVLGDALELLESLQVSSPYCFMWEG